MTLILSWQTITNTPVTTSATVGELNTDAEGMRGTSWWDRRPSSARPCRTSSIQARKEPASSLQPSHAAPSPGPVPDHRRPPAGAIALRAHRQETQVVHLLADLRQQRQQHRRPP